MLQWDQVGERVYETGLDRGVLYPPEAPGVAWNGLLAVNEKTEGEAPASYYVDGSKSLAMPGHSDFAATIQALTYPQEFEPFDGMGTLTDGVIVTHQPNELFGMSWRTLVGNDIDGTDLGYKIHLMYNALAAPSDKAYTTMSGQADPNTFSWDVTTIPVLTPGFKPMAHLVLDSRRLTPGALNSLESVLYGEFEDPRLPLPEEVWSLTLGNRFVIDVATPETPLPPSAAEGDVVYAESNYTVYSWGVESDQVRPVFVISEGEAVPNLAVPGDVIYNKDTGDLYRMTAE